MFSCIETHTVFNAEPVDTVMLLLKNRFALVLFGLGFSIRPRMRNFELSKRV